MRNGGPVDGTVATLSIGTGQAYSDHQLRGARISLAAAEMAADHVEAVAAGAGIKLHVGRAKKGRRAIVPGRDGFVDGRESESIIRGGTPGLAGWHGRVTGGVAVSVRIGVRTQICLGEERVIGAKRVIEPGTLITSRCKTKSRFAVDIREDVA